jgi:AraC-like DNA-binding protein
MRTVTSEPKGVLNRALAAEKFRLARYMPSDDLRAVVEHHWVVEWDLRRQEPHLQKTLPYPCVHLVFDPGKTVIWGVMRKPFEYRLTGWGRVLGVRFLPGGFRGLLNAPLISITDRTLTLESIFKVSTAATESEVLGAPDDAGMVAVAENLLRRRIMGGSVDAVTTINLSNPEAALVQATVKLISSDQSINRVDELAPRVGIGIRALQRLFSEYVGVSPKWVIRRSRLHEAAARLAAAETVNLTRLAHELGYSDQAHFTREFKALVGRAPSDYRRSLE